MNSADVTQIADILPPPLPVDASANVMLYVFLFVGSILVLSVFYYRSNQQKLKRLQKKFQQQKIDNRHCAYQLSNLLNQVLQKNPKSHLVVLQNQNDDVWKKYISTLQAACYSRRGLNNDAMNQLLIDTERWLKYQS